MNIKSYSRDLKRIGFTPIDAWGHAPTPRKLPSWWTLRFGQNIVTVYYTGTPGLLKVRHQQRERGSFNRWVTKHVSIMSLDELERFVAPKTVPTVLMDKHEVNSERTCVTVVSPAQ